MSSDQMLIEPKCQCQNSPSLGATTFSITTFSTMTFNIKIKNATLNRTAFIIIPKFCYTEYRYAEYHMLNVANNPLMLSVIMPNVEMLSVAAPFIVATTLTTFLTVVVSFFFSFLKEFVS
jgi:hypothetical protein